MQPVAGAVVQPALPCLPEVVSDRVRIQRRSPNRLRHAAATEIRRQFGLEAAQVPLGRATADVTQVYADRDLRLAAEVARKIGWFFLWSDGAKAGETNPAVSSERLCVGNCVGCVTL